MQSLKLKFYQLLRWSEKYFKTDMVYLATGGFWLGLGQIIATFFALLLTIAFANLLPKETYGIYKYVLSAAGILGIFTLSGMNSAVTQAVARGFEGSLKKSFWVQMKWGLLMTAVAFFIGVYYFIHQNFILGFCFLILGVFSPLLNSANTYSAFLNGKKDFKSITKYNFLILFFSSSIILLTLFFTKSAPSLVWAYFVSNTAITVWFYFKTIKIFKPNEANDPETISYGKHLSLMNVASSAAFFLDNLLIFHFLGATSVAIYSLACAPPEQIKGLFKIFSSLAFPKFSERKSGEIKKGMDRKVILSLLAISIVVIVYILFTPLIYKIFFPKYMNSVFYSQIYAISIIAMAYLFPYAALQSQSAKKELYYFNVATSILQIGLLVVMIYYFGIMGAVLSRLVSRFAILFYSMWLAKRM